LQFLNPLALMGLAAALIPLAVHLLHRGKTREVQFSNLAFLRQLHQSSMRSVRLRQWLVLLLRMLILICLALAFSRPALQEGRGLLSGARPTTAVLLLDHSYSTRYTPPEGRVFDRLQFQAESVLRLFEGSRDKVYLLGWPDERQSSIGVPSTIEAARQLLDKHAPGDAAAGLKDAFLAARSLLNTHPEGQRELYLISDLARPDWADIDLEAISLEDGTDLQVFIVGPADMNPRNRFVGQTWVADWLAAPGKTLAIHALVGRWGGPSTAEETTVHLYMEGERVQQRRVSLPVGAPVPVEFSVAPRHSGRLTGFVEIDGDPLPIDNRRYFTFDVPEKISVVIAAANVRDAYYPRRALNAAATGDPTLSVSSISLDELAEARLQDTDVLILANIETPTSQQIRVTRDFAAAGGGVLIVPGADADAARLNRELLADLVPASLASISGRPGGAALVHLDTGRVYSALFEDLLSDPEDQPEFFATFAVSTRQQLAVLARFDDGQPALVDGRSPAGRVLLWPTPFDLAWSDIPLRGQFVPLLQRMVRYLARSTSNSANYLVGDRAWRRLTNADVNARVEVDSPSGRRLVVQAEIVGNERLWKVPDLDEAGIWQLRSGGAVVDAFAVNADIAEADLTPVTAAEIRRRLGEQVRIVEQDLPATDAVNAARFGRELWCELLVLTIMLLLLELWVGRSPAAASAQHG